MILIKGDPFKEFKSVYSYSKCESTIIVPIIADAIFWPLIVVNTPSIYLMHSISPFLAEVTVPKKLSTFFRNN